MMLSRCIRRGLLRAQQLKASSGVKWNFSDDKKGALPQEKLEQPQGGADGQQKYAKEQHRELLQILEQGSKLKCQSCLNAWAEFKKAFTFSIEKDIQGNLNNNESKTLPGADLGKSQATFSDTELGTGIAQSNVKDQQNLNQSGTKKPENINESKTVLAIKEIIDSNEPNVSDEKKILLYGEVLNKFQEAIKEQKNLGEPSIVLTIKKVEDSNEINVGNSKDNTIVSGVGPSGPQAEIKQQMILKQSKVNDAGLEKKSQGKTNEQTSSNKHGTAFIKTFIKENLKGSKSNDEKKSILFSDILEKYKTELKDKNSLDEFDGLRTASPSGGVKIKAGIKEQKHFSQKTSSDGKKPSSPDELQKGQKKTDAPNVAAIMNQMGNPKTPQISDEKKAFLSPEGLEKLIKVIEKAKVDVPKEALLEKEQKAVLPEKEQKAALLKKEQIDLKVPNPKQDTKTILRSQAVVEPKQPQVENAMPEENQQVGIKEFNATDWKNALFPDDYIDSKKPLSKQNIQLLKKIREQGSKIKCATCLATWTEFEKRLTAHINEEYSRAVEGKDSGMKASARKQGEEPAELSSDEIDDLSDSAGRRGPLTTLKSVFSNIFSWKK